MMCSPCDRQICNVRTPSLLTQKQSFICLLCVCVMYDVCACVLAHTWVCVLGEGHMCVQACMWKSEDKLWVSLLALPALLETLFHCWE